MFISAIVLRCMKVIIFTLIATSAFITFAILQSPQLLFLKNAADSPQDPSDRSRSIISRTRLFPQGDDIPKPPPWTTPSPPIISRTADLTGFDGPFITANFSFSPGVGNLMFQYAALLSFSQLANATILIPDTLLLRWAFRLERVRVVDARLLDRLVRLARWERRYARDCCRYHPEVAGGFANDSIDRVILFGYFQSWKYFEDIKADILAEFQFLPDIRTRAHKLITDALKERGISGANRTLIGVHVRHGMDMTWNTRNMEHGHKVAPMLYYLNAMANFRARFPSALFVVFSDDVYYARQNLVDPDVVHANSGVREIDLCALTLTQHTIMSQGTYSWWAAYLTGGEVVYYNGWPRPLSKMEQMTNRTEYFYPGWLGMKGV